jgi:outer membrane receptor protein involved in Fe transport
MLLATVVPALHDAVLHLPLITTVVAALFAFELFRRHGRKGGDHLLWWAIGMITYGMGTLAESWTTVVGWNPFVFRSWYVTGALLGGYPLAQGSIYLLARPRFARWSARVVPAIIAVAALFVFLSPLDLSLAEPHRLSGSVLVWRWVRWISPFVNLYAVVFLVGGAAVSALRWWRRAETHHRAVGNALIAIGALLPGIGGSLTRAGWVEALYVTELVGLILIGLGYRRCIRAPSPAVPAASAVTATAVVLVLLGAGGAGAQTAPAVAPPPKPPAATGSAASAPPAKGERKAGEKTATSGDRPAGSFFDATTVTATGSERSAFEIATPVTVIPAERIQRLAVDNPAQLLREQPGVDVNGVGPNQARPVIRGQRGLRVLFLEDGLRLNNARRQTDFGEISGLVDLDSVATVEVVRGPASVLYGSDAIGGVLNLIPKRPSFLHGRNVSGWAEARYGDAASATRGSLGLSARLGKVETQLGASRNDSSDYDAPAGRFGDIRLPRPTPVNDTSLVDDSEWGSLLYPLTDGQFLRLRGERYHAGQTGFGDVDPAAYGAVEDTKIRILYPFQDFDRWVLTYEGSALDFALADSVDAKVYWQSNRRRLVNDIAIDIGPIGPGFPDSSVLADTDNHTRLETLGLRFEGIKAIGSRQLVTWGTEAYQDVSRNTDFSLTTTVLRFPFPPFEVREESTDDVANAPNATNTSTGVFVQDEVTLGDRLRATGGLRWQQVSTRADATPGWDVGSLDFQDRQLVGSLTTTWQITDELNALASFGTAFRAPNIIERLFNGPTPEGAGYQILNPDLNSEKSRNVDVGLKYRRHNAYFEAVAFETRIQDGVVQYYLSPEEIAALPPDVQAAIAAVHPDFVVQQRNADRLRYRGLEVSSGYRTRAGLTLGGNFSRILAERLGSLNPPTGDTYGTKIVAYARWEPSGGRWWAEYRVRHNDATDAALDPNEPVPPVGRVLPAFTVHVLAGGVTLSERAGVRHELSVAIENLTDELYAEFSNATFFRPEPGRSVKATYRLSF